MRFLVLSTFGLGLALTMGCRTDTEETDDDDGRVIDTDTDTDTDSDTQSTFDCDEGPGDPDAFWGPLDKAQVTTDVPTNDAGLGAVLAAVPTTEGERVTLDPPLVVTKAVVSAAEYAPEGKAPRNIWLRDSGGAIRTYHNFNDDPPKIDIPEDLAALRVGAVVSFEVTEVSNFFGDLQITELKNFTLEPESGLVYVVDVTDGTEITFAQHRAEVVRFWGEVAEERGACPEGSSNICYGIETNGNTYELRIRKDEYRVGDCLPISAPVGQFQGNVQFNISDFDAVGQPF